jgi:hypothetical protein
MLRKLSFKSGLVAQMVEYYDNGGSVKSTQRDAERESRNRITVIVNAGDSVMPTGSELRRHDERWIATLPRPLFFNINFQSSTPKLLKVNKNFDHNSFRLFF